MNSESVVVLSGCLKINGQKYKKSSEKRSRDGTKVQFIVYKTSNRHFALIYPQTDLVCANRPFCCLNLKTCTVNIKPGVKFVKSHKILINTNNDLNCLRLILKVEAKNYTIKDLYRQLRNEDQELSKPFGPLVRRSVSRQTSLCRVDEDREIA